MRWVVALLLLVPLTAADGNIENTREPVATTLWIHPNEPQTAMMSIVEPPAAQLSSVDFGIVGHSQGCVENPTGTLLSEARHTTWAMLNTGTMQYEDGDANQPRASHTHAIVKDLHFEPESTPMLYWSLQTQWESGETGLNAIPTLAPQTVLLATLLSTDSSQPYDHTAPSTVLATSQSQPAMLHPALLGDHPDVTYASVEDRHVYDFALPMELTADTPIPRGSAIKLRIDVFIENPACDDPLASEYIMPDFVRNYSDAEHRPRIDLSVVDAFQIQEIGTRLGPTTGSLLVDAVIASVWGIMDVPGATYGNGQVPEVIVSGNGEAHFMSLVSFVGDCHCHMAHLKFSDPVEGTWVWDGAADASPGTYEVSIRVQNMAGNAFSQAVETFEIGAFQSTTCALNETNEPICTQVGEVKPNETVPSLGPIGVIALIAALATARRR